MATDLLEHFVKNESYAIPILTKAIENSEGKLRVKLNFNIFDFDINFETGSVVISDACGIFNETEKDRDQLLSIQLVKSLLKKIVKLLITKQFNYVL